MIVPKQFQRVFDQWTDEDINVGHADWTSKHRRHMGAQVECDGERCYAKLALANRVDQDEPEMLNGMRREVWWSRVIEKLSQAKVFFPFVSPRTIATNVDDEPFIDTVAWVIMEHIDGGPIVDLANSSDEQFDCFLSAAITSLLALEQIHPRMLDVLGLPPLPSPPHGMRRWQKRGLLDMTTAVLGNGAFEVENFWRDTNGRIVVMDNEFAGWYPRYDHLSYLYHRLYCNGMRPDLAERMLDRYMQEAMRAGDFNASPDSLIGFWKSFARILKPRVLGGWYYDTVRRRLPPWHKKQRLRYGLIWHMLRGHYGKLLY